MKAFDRKFGEDFVAGLPAAPGVYRIFNSAGVLIYVGKAKNLRRRLAQYRNAKRRKRHHKMREIVTDAARISIEVCESELAACLLEAQLIRDLRPRWNVAGAFSFLYPLVGLKRDGDTSYFVYTTVPEKFAGAGLELHGAYRSREIAGEAFFALMRLLKYVGHAHSAKQSVALLLGRGNARPEHSYVFAFRRLPEGALESWRAFLRGEAADALAELSVALLENAGARADAREVQGDLRAIRRFWRAEAQRLARALRRTGHERYPLAQGERDAVFLRYKFSFRQEAEGGPHFSKGGDHLLKSGDHL